MTSLTSLHVGGLLSSQHVLSTHQSGRDGQMKGFPYLQEARGVTSRRRVSVVVPPSSPDESSLHSRTQFAKDELVGEDVGREISNGG